MFKSKSIAFLLIAAMLASMFAVFPAMTVSADGPTAISNVQPAIPATVGSEITLSDYSVQLNNGTVLSPSEITWYNESNTAITRFTPSVAGVTKLTAKKTSDASVSKTIYVVAKNASDSEYMLYFTDFNSASDLDGWNKIVSTGDVYTVSNGKLTISGLNTNNPRIYLPSWLGDFGDYRIDVVGTQTNPTDSSRWFSVIYRAQNPATIGIPYYHMCVRNNATAGATSTTGGVELAYLYNNTWNYVKSSSYTEPINAAKNYTFSVLAKGSTIQYQINGDVVIHVDDVPTLGGDPATRRGGKAGRPRPEVNDTAKARSISAQSISTASRTSGCFMLICSSNRGRNNSPVCGCEGFGPMGLLGQICKKTGAGKTIPCKSHSNQVKETRIRSMACALFSAD